MGLERCGIVLAAVLTILSAGPAAAQRPVPVGIVVNPFNGDRAGPETDGDAAAMLDGGLREAIAEAGGRVADERVVALDPQQEREYGRWNRFGLASGHLANHAADHAAAGFVNLGLYNNCNSLLGMLGGLRLATDAPRRVGLVWIDAHGDYNTPETTLSGMLGGMPVAIAAGDALHRMRRQAQLDPPLPKDHIVMAGVRDTDPLEQQRIERDGIAQLTVDDLRTRGEALHREMRRLSEIADVIYVHVDLDVLDPAVVPGHPLTVPDGPTGDELAAAVEALFHYPKTRALGIASYPHRDDPDHVTLRAVRELVRGAVRGAAAQPARSPASPSH